AKTWSGKGISGGFLALRQYVLKREQRRLGVIGRLFLRGFTGWFVCFDEIADQLEKHESSITDTSALADFSSESLKGARKESEKLEERKDERTNIRLWDGKRKQLLKKCFLCQRSILR